MAEVEKRHFTLQEARKLLPEIRDLVERAATISEQMQVFQKDIEELARIAYRNSGSPAGSAYVELMLRLQSCIGRIHDRGCLVKSVEDGLIDFPHMFEGREVYLCWRRGEDDIEYWHETDAGFDGRQPIGDLDHEEQ